MVSHSILRLLWNIENKLLIYPIVFLSYPIFYFCLTNTANQAHLIESY
jgi:hypothetical protein